MRRRPVAVYRVIDEEELLGGDGTGLLEDEHALTAAGLWVADERCQGRPRRNRLRRANGWPPTALGVAALACVAGLLLGTSSHARVPAAVPAASPLLTPVAGGSRAIAVVAPVRRSSSTRRARRPLRPRLTRATVQRASRAPLRQTSTVEALATRPAPPPTIASARRAPARVATPAPPAPVPASAAAPLPRTATPAAVRARSAASREFGFER